MDTERIAQRSTRYVRWLAQASVLAAASYAAIGVVLGRGGGGVERYCPFGGLETAWSVVTRGQVSCATSETNLTLMLALVVATLVLRKGFCSWVCPVGTVAEWLARAGALFGRPFGRPAGMAVGLIVPASRVDRILRWLRLPVLAAILVGTALTGELVFRSYDPYYIAFSLGGHDVRGYSYVLVGALAAGAVVVPMLWCRWLCPLGAALWPLSRVALVRMSRDEGACTRCGSCDRACPHSLAISSMPQVRSGECTLCGECQVACPTAGALNIVAGPSASRRVSALAVLALLVLFAAAGVVGGRAIAIPSYSASLGGFSADAVVEEVMLVVDGVRCVDTARRAAGQLERVRGVGRITAYASRGSLAVQFDPSVTSVDEIVHAIEGPVHDETNDEYIFHAFTVRAVDGRSIP